MDVASRSSRTDTDKVMTQESPDTVHGSCLKIRGMLHHGQSSETMHMDPAPFQIGGKAVP